MKNQTENLFADYNVSRETFDKLKLYSAELLRWNKKINLISKSTEQNIWERHILDSAQLAKFIEKDKIILDIGSGAGLPGMVLAILGFDITMVEKNFKKFQFLIKIKSLLSINTTILNAVFPEKTNIRHLDVITCRALGKISDIIKSTESFFEKEIVYVLPKGENYQQEIDQALEKYSFEYDVHESFTNKESRIITLRCNDKRNHRAS